MRDIIFILFVLLCAANSLRRPVFGLWAYVAFSLVLPHSLTWGMGRSFPFAQIIALCTLLGYLVSSEPKRIPLRRETLLLIALWLVFGATTLAADYPDRALTKLMDISKILIMIFLSMALINTRERLRILMLVFSLSIGFHAIKGGAFFILSGGSARIWGPEGSFLEANNSIGLAMAMNLPLAIHLLALESNKWLRRILMLVAFFTFPAVVGTFSRGAWLGLAAGTGLLIAKGKRPVLIAGLVVIVALAILPFTPDPVTNRYEELRNYDEEDSAMSRLWSWRFAYRVALANPMLGAGFEYYGIPAYLRYWPEFLDYWPDSQGWSCHSIWFTILSEHGFPGLFVWIALLGSCLLTLRALARLARRRGDEWARRYAVMVGIAFTSYAITGTFLDAAYFDILYQLVAVVVMLREITWAQVEGPVLEQRPMQVTATTA